MKKFKQRTFSGQIRYYYIFLFLLIFLLCGILYMVTAFRMLSASDNNILQYSLQMVENNMQALVRSINDNSKIVAFDEVIQNTLKKEGNVSYKERMELQDTLVQMVACCDGITSIYLFDLQGENYLAGDIYEVEAIRSWLNDTSGYESTLEKQNLERFNYVIFTYQAKEDSDQQMISFVRPVRDIDTLDVLGTLAVNISYSRLEEVFSVISEQNEMDVAILDRNGDTLITSPRGSWLAEEKMEKDGAYVEKEHEGEKYKTGIISQSDGAWKIIGAIPRSESLSVIKQYTLLNILLVVLGMIMCVVGASFLTAKIIRPIKNILDSMKKIGEGKLERIQIVETNAEIDYLQQNYNQMLDETEILMSQKVEEQRLRRKYELSLLQAQIKPHFLYNTFDSVCALAMMGRSQDVYKMMQALGQYYRNSLHKGQEVITVKEEIDIVRNYLIIQSYRYDNVFKAVYDIDESVNSCRMIKLILQPLVENAIYHGLREPELTGTIIIRAKDGGNYVILQVEDDGIGMEKEKLDFVLNRSEENQGKRFGLFGTIQRLRLYYQDEEEKLVEIWSEKGKGTVITIRIPKEKGEE